MTAELPSPESVRDLLQEALKSHEDEWARTCRLHIREPGGADPFNGEKSNHTGVHCADNLPDSLEWAANMLIYDIHKYQPADVYILPPMTVPNPDGGNATGYYVAFQMTTDEMIVDGGEHDGTTEVY